jgi:diguanylate cyclase (GGDEF)-like protein
VSETVEIPARRAWRTVPVLVALCVVVSVGTFVLGRAIPGPLARVPFMAVIGTAAGFALVGAWRWRRRLGASGFFLAGALLAQWAGDVGYCWSYYSGSDQAPSWTLATSLPGYVMLLAGVLLLVRRHGAGRDVDAIVDSAIVTTGVGVLAFAFVISDLATAPGVPWTSKATGLAYPLLDVMVAGVMARVCVARGLARGPVTLVSLAMLSLLVGDAWFTGLAFSGSTVDFAETGIAALYLLYATLLAAAFWPADAGRPRGQELGSRDLGLVRGVALSCAALLAPATLLTEYLVGLPLHVLSTTLGSLLLMVLVTVRLLLVVRRVEQQSTLLAELARNDALTGLPNRRSFDFEIARAAGSLGPAEPLSLAILDLDHFQAFNDSRGHAAGDALLVDAARAWRDALLCVAPRATLARWGGEEFAVVLPGTDAADAVLVLRTLLPATPEGQTFSAGVAAREGLEPVDEVMAAADAQLYAAKSAGRARVHGRCAGAEVAAPVPSAGA